MQYLEFTHSQSFETFVRCHVHAFQKLNGIAREIWYDNLATAVADRLRSALEELLDQRGGRDATPAAVMRGLGASANGNKDSC
jgi:transposase